MPSSRPIRRAAASRALASLMLVAACAGNSRQAGVESAPAPGRDSTAAARGAPASATTSSVSTARDWENRSNTRVEELFVGRFPGVQVFQAGGGLQVRIRGTSSVRGNNEPLYIVDGFPYTPGQDGLIALNPSDVAKIEVLKDAAQTAEYGSRGANGVVKITTKRR
jgi:TonB-dependent SusC/RagA subfamily outer membrane receptor